RLLAGLDVVEELIGEVGERPAEPGLLVGVAPLLVLQKLFQLPLGDGGVAVEVVPLALELDAPEAARGVEPGLALRWTCGHGQALQGNTWSPRKARSAGVSVPAFRCQAGMRRVWPPAALKMKEQEPTQLVVTPALAMSGRLDSNQRPPEPHSGALAKLRHAPDE